MTLFVVTGILLALAQKGFGEGALRLTKTPLNAPGYVLVHQKVSSLEKDRQYKFIAEIEGRYNRNKYDTLVEISEGNVLERGALKTAYTGSVTRLEMVCTTPK